MFAVGFGRRIFIDPPGAVHLCWPESSSNNFIYIYIYVAIGEKSIHRLPIYMSVIKSKVKDQQNQENIS